MKFVLEIKNIQHIKSLSFSTDLSLNKLTCIVGKNGVGKTTLIRAIKNLQSTDTFSKTASPYIFNSASSIHYQFGDENYNFQYNEKLKVVDTRQIISDEIKRSIHVELPIPHGERFHHFQKLGSIDEQLRKSITMQEFIKPVELINFLSKVYNTDRFENLKQITVKGKNYYFILKKDDFYIREDYLSSGEYFVINLHKIIQARCKFIVIDEIDISLDASAQVNLIDALRRFCVEYQVNIVFTTHSMALIKTLNDSELYYMSCENEHVLLTNKSYNYVKSVLFGFKGWDKYILTEDKVLENYLRDLIEEQGEETFYEYKIIYIGGGSNVVDLMNRNKNEHFFSTAENVLSVLDGDQKGMRYCRHHNQVHYIPFESVEKYLKECYDLQKGLPKVNKFGNGKDIFQELIKTRKMSAKDIFRFINNQKTVEVALFRQLLMRFLSEDNAV